MVGQKVSNVRTRVVSSSNNRTFAPISEQMLDLFRLCSDFVVSEENSFPTKVSMEKSEK